MTTASLIRLNDRDRSIVQLKNQGLSRQAIADELRITRNAVAGVLHRHKDLWDARRAGRPARIRAVSSPVAKVEAPALPRFERKIEILRLRGEGVGPKEIGELLGMTAQNVANVISNARKAGWKGGERPVARVKLGASVEASAEPIELAPSPKAVARAAAFLSARPTEFSNAVAALEAVQESGGCRFSFGDPRKSGFHFCGSERAESYLPIVADPAPYCAEHRALCISKTSREAPQNVFPSGRWPA